jgi:hypothetical protein
VRCWADETGCTGGWYTKERDEANSRLPEALVAIELLSEYLQPRCTLRAQS